MSPRHRQRNHSSSMLTGLSAPGRAAAAHHLPVLPVPPVPVAAWVREFRSPDAIVIALQVTLAGPGCWIMMPPLALRAGDCAAAAGCNLSLIHI